MRPVEVLLRKFSLRYGPYETFRLLKAVADDTNNWDLVRRFGLSMWNVRLLKTDPYSVLKSFVSILEANYIDVVPRAHQQRRA